MKKEGSVKLVKSAIRAMTLFQVFAEAGRALTLGELAERMDAPKSSCYELLQTLVHLGFVNASDGGKSYYPSRRLYELARQIDRFNPIRERIEAALKNLRDLTGETVVIGRLHGNQVVFSEVFDGTHSIRYTARSGDQVPVHASALGKALLASLDEPSRGKLLDELDLERFNKNTITTKRELEANLAACVKQGVYTTRGEYLGDVMGMACPLRVQGHRLAAGVAGPVSRMEKNFRRYAQALLEAVANIEHR